MLRRLAFAWTLSALFLGPAAATEAFPERPITVIVPFAPAGGTDAAARVLAPILGDKLGTTIVIENQGGAAGNIGATRAARAPADGYTLLMHNVAFAINATLYRNLPFDVERDFAPIAFVNHSPLVIVGRKSLPAAGLAELVSWMRANRAKVAHPGLGSIGHMSLVPLLKAAEDKVDLLPYRGGGPALQDVIAGHADIMGATLQGAFGPIRDGLVTAYAVTTAEPAPSLPGVPSIASELGPRSTSTFWNMIAAPAGTPRAVIEKLAAAIDEALSDPDLVANFAKTGVATYPKAERTPEGAQKLLKREIAHWAEIVRDNKLETP